MRTLCALLIALLVGCATKPVARLPMPPTLKARKSLKPLPPPVSRIIYEWEDCAPQPSNTWYRIYESLDFKSWHLYAQVTNGHSIVIPTTNSAAFYSVAATDGTKELRAEKDCP